MNKRGQSHIEFIISFALFTTFVVFIMFLLQPSAKSSEIGLNSIENSIMANVSTNLSFFSVKIDSLSSGEDCSCFSDYPEVEGYIIVKNSSKEIVPANKNNDICIETNGETFFYVYSSNEFENTEGGCTLGITRDAEIGQLRELDVVSNKSLYVLNETYYTNYAELKQEFGLVNYDFGVKVIDDAGDIVIDMSRKVPLARPVYSRDVPIQIIYKDGGSSYDIMRISAW